MIVCVPLGQETFAFFWYWSIGHHGFAPHTHPDSLFQLKNWAWYSFRLPNTRFKSPPGLLVTKQGQYGKPAILPQIKLPRDSIELSVLSLKSSSWAISSKSVMVTSASSWEVTFTLDDETFLFFELDPGIGYEVKCQFGWCELQNKWQWRLGVGGVRKVMSPKKVKNLY